MTLTIRSFAGVALVASVVVLAGALAMQYWGGLIPCELCLLERWPWRVAIVIALVGFFLGHRMRFPWVALLLAAVYAVSTVFALYHVGVEQHWFAGPSACTAAPGGAMTLEQMKAQLRATPAVMCDQIQWSLFGVSLAGWNLVASLIMTSTSGTAFMRARRATARWPARI
jgi:disulfide bond formation protein DsbB